MTREGPGAGEPIPPIEHLVFSTREARPEGGTGFNREVVASSPGVPDSASRELVGLSDMTGPVLARQELPPLWAFRRLDSESWLLARAVSLGLYRKGHHQLLIHGAVLPRELVDRLDGNPFLLATPEARSAGFRFVEEHPGGRSELSPLTVSDDGGLAAFAWRANLERLAHLTARFRKLAPGFPSLYERAVATLRRSRDGDGRSSLALVTRAAGQAEAAGWIEWLLLHLHPADRAEVAFHTAYAYEQETPFDWLGAAEDDLPGLRRQLRGLATWSAAEAPAAEPGDDPPLGVRLREVRDRAPDLLLRTLETYYLTRVPGRHGTDLRKNPFHPLDPDDVDLCLRGALQEPLDEPERRRLVVLAYRGGQGLSLHVGELAEAWWEGPSAFEAHLARLADAADELRRLAPLEPGDAGRLPILTRPEERFGFLALLSRLLASDAPEPGLSEHAARLARAVAPPSELPAMLALFDTPERQALAERELAPWSEVWIERGIESAGRGEDSGSDAAPAWETWLLWLHRTGRPVAPVAGRVERAILQDAPDGAAEGGGHRLIALRRLARVCGEIGLDPFALRLLFQREIPRLSPAAAKVRWADGVAWLFRGGEETAAADPFLAPALADPEILPVVLDAVADRLLAAAEPTGAGPEASWSRARRLFRAQLEARPRATLPPAAAGAVGGFLARLAAATDAAPERLAEMLGALAGLGPPDGPAGDTGPFRDAVLAAAARRLGAVLSEPGEAPRRQRAVRGVSALLEARLVHRPLGEPEPAVDRALLDAALPALVLSGPRDGAGEPLRAAVSRHLRRLLEGGRLLGALGSDGAAGPWRHLLLDELLAAPPANPEDDPRYRAVVDLAWRRWSSEIGRPGASPVPPATVALAGVLPFPGPADPGEPWHRRALRSAVDPALRADAERLLATLLHVQ